MDSNTENNKTEYNPYKTAIMRYDLSKPTKELLNRCLLLEPILDWGCGKGEDVRILDTLFGLKIIGYDKYNPLFDDESLLEGEYNTIIVNYVFNVIDSLNTHKELLEMLMKYDSNIYICVRSDSKSIKSNWNYDEINMGYWTSNHNTFQRFYTEQMCYDLFGNDIKFLINNQSMKLFKLK